MLLDAAAIGEVVTQLRADDFYRESHRRIFDAMVSLYDSGKGVDAVLVREELRRRGDLEAAGGPEAIVNLLDRVPTAAHAAHYAGIVRDASIRRGIIVAADKASRAAYDGTTDGPSIAAEARAALEPLSAGSAGEVDRAPEDDELRPRLPSDDRDVAALADDDGDARRVDFRPPLAREIETVERRREDDDLGRVGIDRERDPWGRDQPRRAPSPPGHRRAWPTPARPRRSSNSPCLAHPS